MEIKTSEVILKFNHHQYEIEKEGKIWRIDPSFSAKIILKNERHVLFKDAKQIASSYYENEFAKGILTRYRDIKGVNFAFDTLVWIEMSTQDVYFEWIPINDNGFDIKEIDFPGNLLVENVDTYIPYQQGICVSKDNTNSYTLSNNVYELSMPWLAQIQGTDGYMMIHESYWDAKYIIEKEKDYTFIKMTHLPSLGKMSYKRCIRYTFMKDVTYLDLCERYKQYLKEHDYSQKINITKEVKENKKISFKTMDKDLMIQKEDGAYEEDKHLCISLWKYYLKNETNDCNVVYLEDFNKVEECNNPKHRISRKEAMMVKRNCIQYLWGKEVIPILSFLSSYVVNNIVDLDDYLKTSQEDLSLIGKEVPLFNLVYGEDFKFISRGRIINPNEVIINYKEGKYTLK